MTNFYTGGGSRTSGQLIGTTDFLIEVAKGTVLGHSLVFKYGRNPDIDTGTDPEDVWTYGGTYTYNNTPSIQYISSDNALDIGMEITVEGLDENYNPQSITVALNGQTQTQIGTGETFVRVFRAYNSGPLEFAGNLLIYDDTVTSVTLGVPSPTTSVKAEIKAIEQQTYMAIYTIPAGKTGYFLGGAISLTTGASANKSAIVDLKTRQFGGVFRSQETVAITSTGTSNFSQDLHALGPLKIPEKTDIKARVRQVDANDTGVAAYFSILLVDN
jgi:hypothetical protein